jgi:site-specific recombinase XerD
MQKNIDDLIEEATRQLGEMKLSEKTLQTYSTRAFRPLSRLCLTKRITELANVDAGSLRTYLKKQYDSGEISKQTLNWRLRGLNILLEISETGFFEWKTYHHGEKTCYPDFFEKTLSDFALTLTCSKRRAQMYRSIIGRFIVSVTDRGMGDFSQLQTVMVKDFIMAISVDRPKSMDDVMTALRGFLRFLSDEGLSDTRLWAILAAPRSRDHRVKPCMRPNEIAMLLRQIDRSSDVGKRDFAILYLAATTGFRAGDLASLKLTNVDWSCNELRIVQGKTQKALALPLQKPVLTAIADYILSGRPESKSKSLFLRSQAPYLPLNDGVSIACVFKKYLAAAGLEHVRDDGKTIQGMRRTLGTQMTTTGTPVPTVAQVLGHKGIKATKQYISLDVEGLRKCALSVSSIGGVLR